MDTSTHLYFYRLTNADKRGEIRVKPLVDYDRIKIKKGESQPTSLDVKIDQGVKFYDIVCFQDPHNFAFSDRIHQILIENQISGWRSFPINIDGTDENYWGIQITGRAGPPFRPHEGFVDGLAFDLNTWDGSDIFILEGTLFTLLSQKLRDLLVKQKTSNLEIDEISRINWYNSVG